MASDTPRRSAPPRIECFLSSLAVEGRVAASTQNQALAAILFLYRDVLGAELPWMDGIVQARRPERLPVVLSRHEAAALLGELGGRDRIMATLLYGSGLRLSECIRLRVKDVDLEKREILVRGGKGDKDRVTMLPEAARRPLIRHLTTRAGPESSVLARAGEGAEKGAERRARRAMQGREFTIDVELGPG